MKKLLFGLFVPGLFLFHSASAQIIPANRRMNWTPGVNVGVPGGIPTNRTEFVNVRTVAPSSPYYCAGDGVTNDAPNLQAALNACPPNQYVYAPAATYILGGTVVVRGPHRNYSLRGDGMGRTIFKGVNGVGRFSIGSGELSTKVAGLPVTAGATRGSTVLTVEDARTVNVGNLVTLQMDTPTWMHKVTQAREGADAWNTHFRMTFKVVNKTSTTVTITPPLPMTLTEWNPKIIAWGGMLTEGVGFENLTLDATTGSREPYTLIHAWGCWLKGVEVKGTKARQFKFLSTCASEIRRCYTHDTQGTGPNHEGIDFVSNACWNLVEDNICVNGGKPQIILGDAQGGCVGNVIGYNYTKRDDPGGTSSPFEVSASDSHAVGDMFNLYEGNIFQGFKADGYFGSSSHGTLFRNWIHNNQVTNFAIAVDLAHYSNYYNLVGNVLGTPARVSQYDTETTGPKPCIYRLGFPNTGNFSYANGPEGTPNSAYGNLRTIGPTTPPDYTGSPNTRTSAQALDLNVKNTIIRHGNFDYATLNGDGTPRTPGVVWETNDARGTGVGFADHTIPDSLYLSSRSATGMVWGDGTDCAFPVMTLANLPDSIAGSVIPAKYRYDHNMADPPGRIQTPTATATATATAASTTSTPTRPRPSPGVHVTKP